MKTFTVEIDIIRCFPLGLELGEKSHDQNCMCRLNPLVTFDPLRGGHQAQSDDYSDPDLRVCPVSQRGNATNTIVSSTVRAWPLINIDKNIHIQIYHIVFTCIISIMSAFSIFPMHSK